MQQHGNKGKRNAALPDGVRKQIHFSVSVARERANAFGDIPDEYVSRACRNLLETPGVFQQWVLLAEQLYQERDHPETGKEGDVNNEH